MRRVAHLVALLALSVAAATSVWAQQRTDLEPLADAPAPPPMLTPEQAAQQDEQVTIRKRDKDTVEEYRINGHLYKVVVHPEHGAPYTLVDQSGNGVFSRVESPAGPAISVPMWVIGTF